MLVHVTRDRSGRRRLDEIATLRQDRHGRVQAITAWHVDGGMTEQAGFLRALVRAGSST